jgi:hypothetical protein
MLENYRTSPDVLKQVENAKKNIDALIDYHLEKCGGNKEEFRQRLPVSTTINWDPPGAQAQEMIREHYIASGFSEVVFEQSKGEFRVTLG